MARPLLLGPMFRRILEILLLCFKEGNAIVQVGDTHAFESAVKELCADASKREAPGSCGLLKSLPLIKEPPGAV